ncbi:MAG: ParB/RepB/Spo0J family partition protein [Bacteroidota bacterium]
MAKKVKKSELGKGIGALLSSFDSNLSTPPPQEVVKDLTSNVASISIEHIEVNPFQPRKAFDETALQELSESLKVHGLIQPITVRRMGDHQYQLISGERRFRASKLAGLKEIPAYVRLANDQEMLEMALVENIQREQLNAMEVAFTYQRLIDECKLTHEALAERVGKSRVSITNYIRLLALPPNIQKAIKTKAISMGHARALAGVDNLELQLILFSRTVNDKLSVRDLEKLIASYREPSKVSKSGDNLPEEYQRVKDNLRNYLSAKVDLKRKKSGKGQIIIPFSSYRDLNRILDLIEE